MRKYRSPAKRKRRRIALALAALLCAGFVLYVHYNVTQTIVSVAERTLRAEAARAVNEAVFLALSEGVGYDALVHVTRDEAGGISSLTADMYVVNQIARTTASAAQERLEASGGEIGVPLGAFFGLDAWAGAGPEIAVKILPVCHVLCTFSSDFSGAGINQTRHAIYLHVVADISIVFSARTRQFSVESEVLLAESVLVGKVPEVYLQGDLFSGGASASMRATTAGVPSEI